MPDVPRRPPLRRLLAEWPLLGAAAALLSLAWLPRFLPSRASAEEAAVAFLRDRLGRGDVPAVEAASRDFLSRYPGSALAGEVHELRGRAALRSPSGSAADAALAWTELSAARKPVELGVLRRDAAHALLDRGRSNEASAAFRELLAEGSDPLVALDLGRVLAVRAARQPREAAALCAEILELAAACRERLSAEKKIQAVLACARLVRRAGQGEDALPLLVAALEDFRSPADRGRLLLERGRTLAQLDRKAEALAALDLADDLLRDDASMRTALAAAHLELQARAGLPATTPAPGPPPRGLLRLLAARNLREISAALAEIPSPRPLDEAGVDLPWIKRLLRSATQAEEDPAALVHAAAAWQELLRLEPEDVRSLLDRASGLARLGDLLRKAESTSAGVRYAEAGAAYELAMTSELLDLQGQERAAREGAEAFARADRHTAAARLFRRWFEFSPRHNAEGLLLQARCLRRARLSSAALDVYGDYAGRAKPGDPGLPEALLERGRLLAELGRRTEAAAEFDRLLREDLGITPDAAEWEAGLLEQGRVLFEMGQADEGAERRDRLLGRSRRALAEYLERYGQAGSARAGVVEASHLLARAAMEQRDWEGALEALDGALAAEPADGKAAAFQREARFLRGDLLFALGRFDEAEQAYGDAARRHAGSPDRLWGVLGRARALSKLGRLEEARREARTGRTLFDEGKPAFEASFGGRGRDYWTAALETLEKEVR